MRHRQSTFPWVAAHELVTTALHEDLGPIGDITTAGCVPEAIDAVARIVAREPLVVCGLPAAETVFAALGPACTFEAMRSDGDWVQGQRETIAVVSGPADLLLMGERTALNFMMHLSGIATRSRMYANKVQSKTSLLGKPVRVVSTRKTRPGLRALERYAVSVGGCHNHRFGLFDGVLVKENHLAMAESIEDVVGDLRRAAYHGLRLQLEVEHHYQVFKALEAGADALLLDNFDLERLRAVVAEVRRDERWNGVLLEASGGIDLENLPEFADTGVDIISSGALIHGATFMDLSMEMEHVGDTHPTRPTLVR